ncbi:DUF4376 domain-containing protein [Halomonas cupida]|uniref:DUF4376 domain-containing protein n=1 Tax=Halomonas cupida TaxID=44933 RepID=UPI003A939847
MMHYSKSENEFYPDSMRSEYKAEGTWPDDAVAATAEEWETYGLGDPPEGMQRVAGDDGRPTWAPIPPLPVGVIAARKRLVIEDERKAAEQAGVVINNVRYAGDPSNRQALREALDLAAETGMEMFPSWKDSDGEFRPQLPVADIHKALLAIAERRSHLIAREGELNAQIDAALEADDRAAIEAIEWPTTQ